jgi:hypothetical protein
VFFFLSNLRFIEFKRLRGYAKKGLPCHATCNPPQYSSYSLTLLSSLTHPNGFALGELRSKSNSSLDFFRFVYDMITQHYLYSYDYLICDNASIHYARDISPMLSILLDYCNIRLIFLPTYSPELNPCELIFAQIKRQLRNRNSTNPFWIDLALALTVVNLENVLRYYFKCIHRM